MTQCERLLFCNDSIAWFCRHDGGITGYIAIQSFGNNTAHDAAAALASLQQEGATSLILDLRGNNGGLVNAGGFLILTSCQVW